MRDQSGMSTSTYIRKKNEILREFIGIDFDLVPEGQLVDVEPLQLSIESSVDNCPYCQKYLASSCEDCPMEVAGNDCGNTRSTWSMYVGFCVSHEVKSHSFIKSPAYKPMYSLVQEYNKSNGF